MTDQHLPTVPEMFERAHSQPDAAHHALEEARGWLRSDWRPVGSELTDEQADRRTRMRAAIATAQAAIEEGWRR